MVIAEVNVRHLTSPQLLAKYGYPTTHPIPVPRDVDRIRRRVYGRNLNNEGLARRLGLNDEDFFKLNLWESEGYLNLFSGQEGPSCASCNEEIVLPIDLRKEGPFYHAVCHADMVAKKLAGRDNTNSPRYDQSGFAHLEFSMRVARVLHPDIALVNLAPDGFKTPGILTRNMLEVEDIDNRKQLEDLYWRGRTPIR